MPTERECALLKNWGSGIYLMPSFGRYDLAADVIEAIKV